jgi:hypothetical protein
VAGQRNEQSSQVRPLPSSSNSLEMVKKIGSPCRTRNYDPLVNSLARSSLFSKITLFVKFWQERSDRGYPLRTRTKTLYLTGGDPSADCRSTLARWCLAIPSAPSRHKNTTFVPTTQPAHAPAIDVVAQLHGLMKPHEFRLHVTHANAPAHACLWVAELSTGRMPLPFPLWATCRTPDREAPMVAGGQPP